MSMMEKLKKLTNFKSIEVDCNNLLKKPNSYSLNFNSAGTSEHHTFESIGTFSNYDCWLAFESRFKATLRSCFASN